ncbi:ATP-dependent metallopeptidase FtsH/Yme1/Tma family protein [Streptomyces gardneri]|uniref:Peptidase M41 FtsH extracellular domain-containing protein n=1 Tax=Streptomyces gardneri TaxID=66892 RepID=A0A4Y3RKH9_9ACTN|nr:ATP-dependent metallopeptidase FtsH/Yme1/Tma family protein [Streptomyces gardneri]GEB57438.1 hypothetical protein SGA01_30430 [Streptomyces gardneri]GHH23777.1 hypothetical protein GCM10017674_80670 [Streptomyces gardneri]
MLRVVAPIQIGGPVSPREGSFGPLREPPRPSEPSPKPSWTRWLLPIVTLAVLLVVLLRVPSSPQGAELSYSDFLGRVGAGQVKTVDINDTGAISGTLKDGGKFTTRIPTALDNSRSSWIALDRRIMVAPCAFAGVAARGRGGRCRFPCRPGVVAVRPLLLEYLQDHGLADHADGDLGGAGQIVGGTGRALADRFASGCVFGSLS